MGVLVAKRISVDHRAGRWRFGSGLAGPLRERMHHINQAVLNISIHGCLRRVSWLEKPPHLTFTHVYFNVDQRGEQAYADANAALTELGDRQRAPEVGDRFALATDYADKTVREVEQGFGPNFGEQLLTAPLDEWYGPVESAFTWYVFCCALNRGFPRSTSCGSA